MEYKIINGTLSDKNGNPVPLEIGNTEQIEFIKLYQSRVESFMGEGLELDVSIQTTHIAEADFHCICGKILWLEEEVDDEDDIECFNGMEVTCGGCKTNYYLTINDDNNVVAIINRKVDKV